MLSTGRAGYENEDPRSIQSDNLFYIATNTPDKNKLKQDEI